MFYTYRQRLASISPGRKQHGQKKDKTIAMRIHSRDVTPHPCRKASKRLPVLVNRSPPCTLQEDVEYLKVVFANASEFIRKHGDLVPLRFSPPQKRTDRKLDPTKENASVIRPEEKFYQVVQRNLYVGYPEKPMKALHGVIVDVKGNRTVWLAEWKSESYSPQNFSVVTQDLIKQSPNYSRLAAKYYEEVGSSFLPIKPFSLRVLPADRSRTVPDGSLPVRISPKKKNEGENESSAASEISHWSSDSFDSLDFLNPNNEPPADDSLKELLWWDMKPDFDNFSSESTSSSDSGIVSLASQHDVVLEQRSIVTEFTDLFYPPNHFVPEPSPWEIMDSLTAKTTLEDFAESCPEQALDLYFDCLMTTRNPSKSKTL